MTGRVNRVTGARVAALAGAWVLGVGTLSGCGVTGTDFRPGDGIQVGDRSISTGDVDSVVDGACAYLAEQPGRSAVARSTFRTQLAQSLLEREAMSQLLEEEGVDLPAEYEQTLAQLSNETDGLPDKQADALSKANEAGVYVQAGEVALGRSIDPANATDDAKALNAGTEALADWIAAHDIEVNPVFGFSADDVRVVQQPVDQNGSTLPALAYGTVDDTSLAVSDLAGLSVVPQADENGQRPAVTDEEQNHIDALPSTQTCG